MLGHLVGLVTLRLESGGQWPDAGLASALQKMNKFVTLLFRCCMLAEINGLRRILIYSALLISILLYLHLLFRF